jgi:predicted tellurium resistance membrane protein TerC
LFSESFLDLFTLATLEVVLGIDNVIFIAIIIQSIPQKLRLKARMIGLSLAFLLRVVMLFGASWIIKLTQPLFTIHNFAFSGRNLLLLIGGIFLIIKSILEIIEMFTAAESLDDNAAVSKKKYWKCITQIIFIDLILSFDSIITAVGITDNLLIIIIAIMFAIFVMLASAGPISNFIYKFPSIKIVALCFIALVGVMLICNGLDIVFPKAYLYITMIFSLVIETLNIMLYKKKEVK